MIPEMIKEIYEYFRKAVKRLEEALGENLSKGSIVVDGTIKRFEFTFELAWKLAKIILDYNNIDARGPRLVIKEAFKLGLIKHGEGWIDMLEDRNKTSHIYDEKQALKIYDKIKENHWMVLRNFEKQAARFIENAKE